MICPGKGTRWTGRFLRITDPNPEGLLTAPELCYNVAMSKRKKTAAKDAKLGGFVVGRARFAKISAVEGIRLTPAMEKRASEAGPKGLAAEEYRRTIVRSYRKG
jgi:hypothetical protein